MTTSVLIVEDTPEFMRRFSDAVLADSQFNHGGFVRRRGGRAGECEQGGQQQRNCLVAGHERRREVDVRFCHSSDARRRAQRKSGGSGML